MEKWNGSDCLQKKGLKSGRKNRGGLTDKGKAWSERKWSRKGQKSQLGQEKEMEKEEL